MYSLEQPWTALNSLLDGHSITIYHWVTKYTMSTCCVKCVLYIVENTIHTIFRTNSNTVPQEKQTNKYFINVSHNSSTFRTRVTTNDDDMHWDMSFIFSFFLHTTHSQSPSNSDSGTICVKRIVCTALLRAKNTQKNKRSANFATIFHSASALS